MTKPRANSLPKPWRKRVERTQSQKERKRRYWTAARWQKHDLARVERRENPPRPYMMALRLARDADRERSRRRRLRMLALKKRKQEGLE